MSRDPRPRFDPEPHRRELLSIIAEIERCGDPGEPVSGSDLDQILRRYPRDGRGFFSRSEIIAGFRHFSHDHAFSCDDASFARRIQLRPVRTQSGVTPLTVLTKPYPCPGRCVFCPNDVRMPKSYLADEPGAQRAANNHFDPYLQTWNRLAAFRAIGHPVEKVELIVLGGTWSHHPEPYQVWFVKRCLDALNDFGAGRDQREAALACVRDFSGLTAGAAAPRPRPGRYNDSVVRFLRGDLDGALLAPQESAAWSELEHAQTINESAGCRSVGLVVETRPDHLSTEEVTRIRRLGCTKVQIGYQSLDDTILARNARGHDVSATRRAMALLRRAGFKIHAHWMPNLLGATPAGDIEDARRIFDDPDFRPDELKVYPCSLIESAELMDHYRSGSWRPYEHAELLDVVVATLSCVPRYCRVTRVIRDISSDDIVTGNKLTNFRQIAEQELERRAGRCVDIRAREIRREPFDSASLALRATEYETGVGRELFLEYVTPKDRLVGFLRLSLPEGDAFLDELTGSALIREVHVYGASLELGEHAPQGAQHRGVGQRLLEEAAQRAEEAGFADLAVISAVGTRPYYRRQGFADGALYQHRPLRPSA